MIFFGLAFVFVACFAEANKLDEQMLERPLHRANAENSALMEKKEARKALMVFAETLTDNDFSPVDWKKMNKSPAKYFDHYSAKLSDIFSAQGAMVNFVLVGACDGTHDKHIEHYLKNPHMRGVFVEPMERNVNEMTRIFDEKEAADRSTIIRAAATHMCTEPTIRVQRPLYEEKNDPKTPHWLRRQIGGIPKEGAKTPPREWVFEDVRCVTGVLGHLTFTALCCAAVPMSELINPLDSCHVIV